MAINKLDTGAIQDNAITNAKMADDAVGVADLAATGTPSSTTFLRGDNSWATAGSTSASDLTSGTLPIARIADDAVTAAKLANSINTDIATGVTGNTTANAALPKAGGAMTGTITGFTSTGIDDNADATAITIDASENVGIGVTDPDSKLEVNGNIHLSGNLKGKSDSTTEIGLAWNNGGIKRIHMINGGEVRFGDTTTTSGLGMTEGAWDSFGDFDSIGLYTRSELKIYGGSNALRFTLDGDGLKFNADTAAANALDDYEVGTWTPQLSNGTAFTQNGVSRYIKIGRLVHIQADINQIPSGSQIFGLPFTANSNYHSAITMGYSSYGSGVMGYIVGGYAQIHLHTFNGSAISSNNHRFIISGSYYANS